MNANVTFDSLLEECRELRDKCSKSGFAICITLLEILPEEERIKAKSIAHTHPKLKSIIIDQLEDIAKTYQEEIS